MKAAVLREYDAPLAIEDVPEPTPPEHGVVVDVEACGVCRSDWHAWKGHGEWADDAVERGQVLGHEPAGRVAAVGERVTEWAVGDRVAVPFSLGDGTCEHCVTGHGNRCSDGYALGFEAAVPGAFAERVAVPHADYNLAALPDALSARDAAALGCRYATAFNGLVERASVGPGDRVAVHGCGGVGLSAVQIAAARGATVVAVDVHEEPLALAADLGAAELVDASGDGGPASTAAAVRELTDGGAHVSVDALGRAETCRNSVRSLRRGGTHVQIGLTTDAEAGEVALPTDAMTRNELDWVGARGLSPTDYPALLRFVAGAAVDPGALVTREVSLEAVPARLAAMDDYETAGVEVVTEF
ncbi:alcohol dehydrogenase catalytic domain-containing protein [Halarchaeum sp. CBA1220]|uniref:zinc-binding dehydrogenase n=1 Tax=Halarchaeum sp. CBA1220 TaxID=1853682 RepID=UPI000F3A94B1|nr:alcohol dehydrogenase catalytic domain-containing protein [Halarchaeum sp. CBA1220]QLC32967.1 alcohol dehydrogenase catalytic domain-containing protein [Halarchaeum sp. CBA1220]